METVPSFYASRLPQRACASRVHNHAVVPQSPGFVDCRGREHSSWVFLPRKVETMDDQAYKPRGRRRLFVLLAVLLVLVVTFVAGMWLADRGERSVAAVTESYAAAYEGLDTTKDVPVLLPLYAPDAVLHDAAADRTHSGTGEIETGLNALLATPDFDLTIERTLVGDDWALVFWTADGMRPDLDRVAQVVGVTSLEVANGEIVQETWYYDPAKAPF